MIYEMLKKTLALLPRLYNKLLLESNGKKTD
jgi:hypothetical protein